MDFYERLRALCRERHTSITTMLIELDMSTGCSANWKKGQLPKGEILIKIADYLDTSIDYMVTGEYRCDLDEYEKKLVTVFRSAPERAKYKILCDVENIVNDETEKLAKEKGAV